MKQTLPLLAAAIALSLPASALAAKAEAKPEARAKAEAKPEARAKAEAKPEA
ncbi:hypothetical protein EEB18_021815 [Sphingopyxis sp. OPL5]|uniref:hypothetical protein n=1 Tax=Sphingopyxis sp. OPL5 TaxID=2486273 RepID=UPI00164D2428|nr:hypothetical protein [Sphingopyxis sp. OPL5]QNO27300.1 hypothetical protein EEB18_021815 [Sphingopyxis sp. OPL5]